MPAAEGEIDGGAGGVDDELGGGGRAEAELTPLMRACQRGKLDEVKAALDSTDVDTTATDSLGKTALHYCAEHKTTDVARLLLDRDPSLLDARDVNGNTTLQLSVIVANLPLTRFLLGEGANIHINDNEQHTLAHWAAVSEHTELIDVIAARGGELAGADVHGAQPLHYAAQMCAPAERPSVQAAGLAMLRTLVARGVPVDGRDNDGRTPLLWAASSGGRAACEALLKARANVESADKDALTALHCAASKGHTPCVLALVGGGARVDSVDKTGCTPLFYAITLGKLDSVLELLRKKPNPTHQDKEGKSAAHYAAACSPAQSLDCLKLLQRFRSAMWMQNAHGDLPLHTAALLGNNDSVVFLLEKTGKVRKKVIDLANNEGRTSLHIAAITGNLPLARYLVERGGATRGALMTHRKGAVQITPYECAVIRRHADCADYLRDPSQPKQGGPGGDALPPGELSVTPRPEVTVTDTAGGAEGDLEDTRSELGMAQDKVDDVMRDEPTLREDEPEVEKEPENETNLKPEPETEMTVESNAEKELEKEPDEENEFEEEKMPEEGVKDKVMEEERVGEEDARDKEDDLEKEEEDKLKEPNRQEDKDEDKEADKEEDPDEDYAEKSTMDRVEEKSAEEEDDKKEGDEEKDKFFDDEDEELGAEKENVIPGIENETQDEAEEYAKGSEEKVEEDMHNYQDDYDDRDFVDETKASVVGLAASSIVKNDQLPAAETAWKTTTGAKKKKKKARKEADRLKEEAARREEESRRRNELRSKMADEARLRERRRKVKPRPLTTEEVTEDPKVKDRSPPRRHSFDAPGPPWRPKPPKKEPEWWSKRPPWNFSQPTPTFYPPPLFSRVGPQLRTPPMRRRKSPLPPEVRGRRRRPYGEEEEDYRARSADGSPVGAGADGAPLSRKERLREEIRIYEQRRVASLNLQRARRVQLQNDSLRSPRKERQLVRQLADDYNTEVHPRVRRAPADTFNSVQDFELYLKGEIESAQNSDKLLRRQYPSMADRRPAGDDDADRGGGAGSGGAGRFPPITDKKLDSKNSSSRSRSQDRLSSSDSLPPIDNKNTVVTKNGYVRITDERSGDSTAGSRRFRLLEA